MVYKKDLCTATLSLLLCGESVHALEQSPSESWYTFKPANNHSAPSAIGMEDWNSEPAGAHGRIELRGEKLYENDKETKLWGLNNTYGDCAPDKEMAEKRAVLYRKFGMNAIRFHKYADGSDWRGIQSEESFVELDPEGLDRMDYYIHVLKENGIYTKLSPTFGVKYGPADISRIPYFLEMGDPREKGGRVRAGYGAIYLGKELQEMQIEQTVKLLQHKNPYTGMRYADDPAIFCIEFFNEDAVLYSGTNSRLQSTPTLRERTAKRFSDWLKSRYGTEKAWRKAWGEEVIYGTAEPLCTHFNNLIGKDLLSSSTLPAESIENGTVVPWGQPWHYGQVTEKAPEFMIIERRMLDTMEFLITLQDEFYSNFEKAVRSVGFDGAVIGSNWRSGKGYSHFYNIWSDAKMGIVDRHNYFGGARNMKGRFNNASMLALPGSGILSAGMQQVDDIPFMLSEWIHVQPNEWLAESAPIIGTYGYGLQGWDISYIFQNADNGTYSPELYGHSWDVTVPQVLATFAAVSRQVRRLDVAESPKTEKIKICIPAFREGKIGINDSLEGVFDIKSYTSEEIPNTALAVTRIAVEFTDTFEPTKPFNPEAYMQDGAYVSTTRQLRWTPAPQGETTGGYYTVDTPRTKAFVGFAPGGKSFKLGDVTITPAKGYSVIQITAKDKNATSISEAKELVVVAMARGRNTGSQLNPEGNCLLEKGNGPILMEPVQAEIKLSARGTLLVLDHDGCEQGVERPVSGSFSIDGTKDRTPFYLIRK